MTPKQLVEILKREMKPIIEETVRPMLEETVRPMIEETMRPMLDQALKPIIETQQIHTRKIDALTADMHKVQKLAETTVDIVKARYENNKREIDEIKDHLEMPKQPYFGS